MFVFKDEPIRFLIAKAEKKGINSKEYREARELLKRNYNLGVLSETELYGDLSRQVSAEGGSKEEVGYIRALSDPRYRMATSICIILAISVQLTGINAINIYSTTIYENILKSSGGSGITPRIGSVLNATAQEIACFVSPFVAWFSFRAIINGGLLIMGITMGVISLLAFE